MKILMNRVFGYWLSQGIQAICDLNIPNSLSDKAITLDALLKTIEIQTGKTVQAEKLKRLLRNMISLGLIKLNQSDSYQLTHLGQELNQPEVKNFINQYLRKENFLEMILVGIENNWTNFDTHFAHLPTLENVTPALRHLLRAYLFSRVLYLAALYQVPQTLGKDQQDITTLSNQTQLNKSILITLFQYLEEIDFVRKSYIDGKYQYELTPDGLTLIDEQGGACAFILHEFQGKWRASAFIADSIFSEKTAFELANDTTPYGYLEAHPTDKKYFDQAGTFLSEYESQCILERLSVSSGETIMDLGGGNGSLLTNILQRNPGTTGILFELASTIAAIPAQDPLKTEYASRTQLLSGDFFNAQTIPGNANCIIAKRVLHNWPHQEALAILKNLKGKSDKIYIIERLYNDDALLVSGDFLLWASFGSGLRNVSEFKQLLSAEFDQVDVQLLGNGLSMITVDQRPQAQLIRKM